MTTFRLGLTGSIGMGKSTTAAMFAEMGIPVWDADGAVHRLYETGGAAVDGIRALAAEAVVDGRVDRERLSQWLSRDNDRFRALEAVVHPLVAKDRDAFLEQTNAPIVLLDIPLLYESGLEDTCDAIAVVTVPEDIQRERVLSRPGMTEDKFNAILGRQLPDAEKRRRADYVIPTHGLEAARAAVQDVLKDIRDKTNARDRT